MNAPTRRSPAGEPGLKSRVSLANDSTIVAQAGDTSEDHPQQVPLFGVPRARGHINRNDGSLVRDPETSRRAAESVSLESVTRLQRAILNVLTLARRPITDEEICDHMSWMRSAESGIRSRRSELLRAGLIEVADERGVSKHGRPCRRYQIARAD